MDLPFGRMWIAIFFKTPKKYRELPDFGPATTMAVILLWQKKDYQDLDAQHPLIESAPKQLLMRVRVMGRRDGQGGYAFYT